MDLQLPQVYLNSATTSWPKAPGVSDATVRVIERMPLHVGREAGSQSGVIDTCRRHLSTLLGGVDADRIVLTQNATMALNMALLGLSWRPGTRAVTSVMEHNSVLRPLHLLEERGWVRLSFVGLDASLGIDVAAYDRALAEEPGLVVLNHASHVTGRINDVGPLFARAKRAGAITVLDASQTLGAVPVHPEALHADLVAFTGHKALRGPSGTGGLYVRPGLELEPLLVGGTGVQSSRLRHPSDMPMRLEAGTPNLPALAGLAAALDWAQTQPPEGAARAREMGDFLRDELAHSFHVRLFDREPGPERLGIVSFQLGGWTVEDAGRVLWENFGVACRTGLHCAPLIHRALGSSPQGTIRLSVSPLTTEEDVVAAVCAVRSIAT